MSTFNMTRLAGNRALITGDTEAQQCILSTVEFDELNGMVAYRQAVENYDDKIKEFYAPITEAAEAAAAALNAARAVNDPDFVHVIREGVPGTEGVGEVTMILGKDTVILNMITSGNTARLLWVGSDIEIVAL